MRPAREYRTYSVRAQRRALALDLMSAPLAPLLRFTAPRGRAATPPRSILVVRLDHLGDVLMSTPTIAALRRALPSARIDVLAAPWGRAALEGNPDVSRVRLGVAPWYDPSAPAIPPLREVLKIGAGLRREPYDWAFDLRGDPRVILFYLLPAARRRFGFTHLGLERFLTDAIPYDRKRSLLDLGLDLVASAGIPAVGRKPVFRPGEAARGEAAAALRRAGIDTEDRFAVIAPAANRMRAQWGAERFASVADGLHAAGIRAVFVGRREDEALVARATGAARDRHANLCGATTLPALAAILERASLLVSNDSGPAHLAAAVDCPTVAIIGPTDAALTFPYEDRERFVSLRGPAGHALPCFDPACAADHGFSQVAPETVVATGLRALAAGRACERRS